MRQPVRLFVLVSGLSILLNVVLGVLLARRTAPPVLTPAEAKLRHSSLLRRQTLPPRDDINHSALLNSLVHRYGYRSYLEIGQGHRKLNFDWINCRIKLGVDPERSYNAAYQMTSDEFFSVNKDVFDLIFIDGLHEAEQVMRDILNSLRVLRPNGTILVHDCNPTTKEMQIVPQSQLIWTGDVWKAWVRLRATRPDLTMYVVDVEHGVGLIRRGRQATVQMPPVLTYDALDKNRKVLLNLVDVTYFVESLRRDEPAGAPDEPVATPAVGGAASTM